MDLRRGYTSIAAEVDTAIKEVLDRGNYILGEEVRSFESEFSRYVGSRFAVGVSSGTSAITIALMANGVGEGDEVVTAANTAIPTVTGILRAGAVPVLVDPAEDTCNLDVKGLEKGVTSRTKAVVPVHLYGNPCDMPSICEFAVSRGIRVIEDCAQAHGAEIGGRRVGSFGNAGCFSFYPTKNLGAFGDGGMITMNSEETASKAKSLRHHGQSDRDEHDRLGMCARLDEVQAAVLRVKLKRLDEWNARRSEIARQYLNGLTKVKTPAEEKNTKRVYHLFVIRTRQRERLRRGLIERGIGTGVHYPKPAHLQKAFSFLGYRSGDFPLSEKLSEEVLSLPLFPELKEQELLWVIESVNSILGAE